MNDMQFININKNRGWRGLAEIDILNGDHDLVTKRIFSFSQAMWKDLILHHKVVIADDKCYYVIKFENTGKLPRPDQQRSVLIKNYIAKVEAVNTYDRNEWRSAGAEDWELMAHFIKNKNNHTTSDWNCIGIRVTPSI